MSNNIDQESHQDENQELRQDENQESQIFDILAHPIRRQIIKELAINESLSYKQLIRITNLKSGPLYHHIHKLKDYIFQDDEKRYYLNDEGKSVLSLIERSTSKETKDTQYIDLEIKDPKIITFFGLTLKPIINFFAKHPIHTLIEFLILTGVCGYLSYRDNILLIGNFAFSFETNIFFVYLSIVLSWLFLGGISELITRFLFKKKEGTIAFLSVTGLTFLPIFLFTIIIYIINHTVQTAVYLSNIVLLVLHGVFQIWTFMVLSTALGVVKKVAHDKSIIVSLILNYVHTIVVILILFT